MVDLKPLEAFVAILRSGSLTKAEAISGIPKASLSRQIARAEAELGAQLFHRESRRMVPTEVGRSYLMHCESLLSELRSRLKDAQADVENITRGKGGRLAVVADNQFSTAFVSTILAKFCGLNPVSTCELDVSEGGPPDFSSIDCYVCTVPPSGPNVVAKSLGRLESCFVASKEYAVDHGVPSHPDELVSHRLITLRRHGSAAPLWLRSGAGSACVDVSGAIQTNNYWVMKTLCIEGMGLALLPGFFTRPEVESGVLVTALAGWRPAPMQVYCAYQKQKIMSNNLRRFIDLLAEDFVTIERTNKYVASGRRG